MTYASDVTASSRRIDPFRPDELHGLQAWYDAVAITGLSDGNSVSTWSDLSQFGRDVTEATNPPTYKTGIVNGLPVVRFDGSNDRLRFAGDNVADTFAQPNTVVAVVHNSSSGTVYHGSNTGDRATLLVNGGEWAIFAGDQVRKSGVTVDTDVHVISVIFDGASSELWYDGADNSPSSSPGTEEFRLIHIGVNAGGSAEYFNGDICEIIVYDNTLTASERQQVEAYLLHKWGI